MRKQTLTITYITDPKLDDAAQRRVISAFVARADEMPLRIAFRLPGATDAAIGDHIDWYTDLAGAERLLPPLVHDRLELAREHAGCRLWLPSRHLQLMGTTAAAYSVHNQMEIETAIARGATEVIYGHVFATASHPDELPRGTEALSGMAAITPNITAIGGINERTIGAVRATGVRSVAVIRAVSRSPDIAATLQGMQESWKGHTNG